MSISNATLDKMITDAAKELNETQRAQLYTDISQAVHDEALYVWVDQATNFHVERTWVQGYYFNPMYSGYYYYSFSKA
jgi:peptide/nickel transport system substrate-binding protein